MHLLCGTNWIFKYYSGETCSLNIYERPTNELILFKVYSVSYLLLHVSASSMPSSGSLHVPTGLLVPAERLIKFCTMDEGGFLKSDVMMCSSLVRNAA
jgi:hypothetical protein